MNATKIVGYLVNYSPHALLIAMVLTFVIAGTFQAMRLMHHGMILAVGVAGTTQIIRLASGFASAGFFKMNAIAKAIMVLSFSLALTIFETYSEPNPEILLMIWSGFFLEIFLGLSVRQQQGNA